MNGISWRAPALFNNDRAAFRLIQLFKPYLDGPLFDAVYGAPMTAWSGGRPGMLQHNPDEELLRRYFGAYKAEGIRCSLTLTRMTIGKKDLKDPLCNMLLDMLDEYDGEAIVYSDELASYIRETHPRLPLVASNIKPATDFLKGWAGCSDEEEYYRRLLERYDRIVIRCEAALDAELRSRLRDIADRCEIIVNPRCVPDCPHCLEHYQKIEQVMEDESVKAGCFYSTRSSNLLYSMCLSREQIGELAAEGFTHFKIEGRNMPSEIFTGYCTKYILGKDKLEEIQSAMSGSEAIELLLLMTKPTDFEKLMEIPK